MEGKAVFERAALGEPLTPMEHALLLAAAKRLPPPSAAAKADPPEAPSPISFFDKLLAEHGAAIPESGLLRKAFDEAMTSSADPMRRHLKFVELRHNLGFADNIGRPPRG